MPIDFSCYCTKGMVLKSLIIRHLKMFTFDDVIIREIMSSIMSSISWFVSELQWVSVWISEFTTLDFEWQTNRFSALLTQFSSETAQVETSLLMERPCVVLTDGNDWTYKVLILVSWPSSMLTSSNGNIFRDTGHVCGEFTGHRWIHRTKASDAELWCFLWSASE